MQYLLRKAFGQFVNIIDCQRISHHVRFLDLKNDNIEAFFLPFQVFFVPLHTEIRNYLKESIER